MYIFILSYKTGLDVVEKHLNAHIDYLNKNYQSGNFIASGRRNPRTGGVIICRAESQEKAQSYIKEDPFYQFGVADYEIIEFEPTMYAEGFDKYINC